jgi:cellobiose-specific phosphotransferase system component IIC
MRRGFIIVGGIILLLAALLFSRFRHHQQHEENVSRGRAVMMGLNAQFMANPRFLEVHAQGYTGTAGIFSVKGVFAVTGSVASSNALDNVRKIIGALNPPGKLRINVTVRAQKR